MLAAAAMQGLQSIYGIGQMLSASEPTSPEYSIPKEVIEAERIMEDRTSQGLPGKEMMMGDMESSFASNIGAVKEVSSGGNLIGATADMYSHLLKGVRDIDIMDSQFRDTAKTELAGAKMQTAQYRDRAWDENERIPYEREYNEFINQRNAGAQNFFGGMSGVTKTYMANQSHEDMMAYMDKIWGPRE